MLRVLLQNALFLSILAPFSMRGLQTKNKHNSDQMLGVNKYFYPSECFFNLQVNGKRYVIDPFNATSGADVGANTTILILSDGLTSINLESGQLSWFRRRDNGTEKMVLSIRVDSTYIRHVIDFLLSLGGAGPSKRCYYGVESLL